MCIFGRSRRLVWCDIGGVKLGIKHRLECGGKWWSNLNPYSQAQRLSLHRIGLMGNKVHFMEEWKRARRAGVIIAKS